MKVNHIKSKKELEKLSFSQLLNSNFFEMFLECVEETDEYLSVSKELTEVGANALDEETKNQLMSRFIYGIAQSRENQSTHVLTIMIRTCKNGDRYELGIKMENDDVPVTKLN